MPRDLAVTRMKERWSSLMIFIKERWRKICSEQGSMRWSWTEWQLKILFISFPPSLKWPRTFRCGVFLSNSQLPESHCGCCSHIEGIDTMGHGDLHRIVTAFNHGIGQQKPRYNLSGAHKDDSQVDLVPLPSGSVRQVLPGWDLRGLISQAALRVSQPSWGWASQSLKPQLWPDQAWHDQTRGTTAPPTTSRDSGSGDGHKWGPHLLAASVRQWSRLGGRRSTGLGEFYPLWVRSKQ